MEKETLKKAMDLNQSIENLQRLNKETKTELMHIRNHELAVEKQVWAAFECSIPPDIAINALEIYQNRIEEQLKKIEQELKEL